MSSKRRRTGDYLPYDIRPCLVAVYHCPLDPKQKVKAEEYARYRATVQDTMGLTEDKIPRRLCNATFLAYREIAIPLKQGHCFESRNGDMLIISLIHCEMDISEKGWLNELCNPVLPADEFHHSSVDIYRSYAQTLSFDATNYLFSPRTPQETWSIDDFFNFAINNMEPLHDLANCAHQQMESVWIGCNYWNLNTKSYEKEITRSKALYQNVQRIWDTQTTIGVSLTKAPLQMGNCDINRWETYKDPCGSNDKSRKLYHALESPCTCGLVSWKTRSTSNMLVPYVHIRSILLHQLKELLIQTFFGAVY